MDHSGLNTTLDDVRETFEFLDDWEDKYRYVIDLGKKLPTLDDDLKTDAYKVRGCQSQVWVVPAIADGTFYIRGDSDAHIVRGLVALMLVVFNGLTPAEARDTDAKAILDELGLASHLSPQRANGLFAMVQRIQALAAASA